MSTFHGDAERGFVIAARTPDSGTILEVVVGEPRALAARFEIQLIRVG